jgi:endoglucanase
MIRVSATLLLAASLVAPAQAEPASWTGPLSTRGRWIVDAHGDRFKLKSGNWHGASGTWNGSGDINDPANHHAGEKADQVPLGLDLATMTTIINGFKEIGVNSVRLPFSNQMIKDTNPVSGLKDARLNGKRPLEIYDAVVAELTRNNLAVILNNHTATSRWCCGVDGNERWNTSQSTDQWINDWAFMADRYKANKRVVGAEPKARRHQPHGQPWSVRQRSTMERHDPRHQRAARDQRLGFRLYETPVPARQRGRRLRELHTDLRARSARQLDPRHLVRP